MAQELKKPKEGKLYEKYVSDLFKLAGFKVVTNKLFKKGDITHEIDVLVTLGQSEKPLVIECKNVNPQSFNKGLMDAYIGKLSDLEDEYSNAVFIVSLKKSGENEDKEETLRQYRSYCKRKGITFLDEADFEELKDKVGEIETNQEKQEFILKSLNASYASGGTGLPKVVKVILIILGIIAGLFIIFMFLAFLITMISGF